MASGDVCEGINKTNNCKKSGQGARRPPGSPPPTGLIHTIKCDPQHTFWVQHLINKQINTNVYT